MKDLLKTGLASITFATMPLNTNADVFLGSKERVKDNIEISLYDNLVSNNSLKGDSESCMELVNLHGVDRRIVANAALSYFDNEVKMFKFSKEAKDKITLILYSYLSEHPVLLIGENGKMEFVIDNKNEFAKMVKQFANVIFDDMPAFVRKIIIPVFLGGRDTIQDKLSNLDGTVMNMKEKQYKDVVFDYLAGIIKRVAISVNGNMNVGDYYNRVVSYYPNKHSGKIMRDLDRSGFKDQDIKNLKYPFK